MDIAPKLKPTGQNRPFSKLGYHITFTLFFYIDERASLQRVR
jgi:hypothetical protein